MVGCRCADHAWERIKKLESKTEMYRKALEQIQEGRGPFSNDQLEFASNTIEAMKELAMEALK